MFAMQCCNYLGNARDHIRHLLSLIIEHVRRLLAAGGEDKINPYLPFVAPPLQGIPNSFWAGFITSLTVAPWFAAAPTKENSFGLGGDK